MLHEVFYHTYAVVFCSLTLIFWFVFFLFDFKTSLMENSIDSIKGFAGFVCNGHKPCLVSKLNQGIDIRSKIIQVSYLFHQLLRNRLAYNGMKCAFTNVGIYGHLSSLTFDTDKLFLCETNWYGLAILFLFRERLAPSWIVDNMFCHLSLILFDFSS